MSIYKKFIESSSSTALTSKSPPRGGRQISMGHRSCAGGRAQLAATLSPIASVAGSALSSTPVANHRQHCKRLIDPSADFALSQPTARHQSYCHPTQARAQYHHHHRHHFHQHSTPSRPQVADTQPTPPTIGHHGSCHSLISGGHMGAVRARADLRPGDESRSARLCAKLSPYNTNDPVLLEWLRSMRFQPDLECLTALQARTLAADENVAGALSVRNSQVAIQEVRLESDLILGLADQLIEMLPANFNTIDKFAVDFSELWRRLSEQTAARARQSTSSYIVNQATSNLTIINHTPRKSLVSARTLRPLDQLAVQIRNICMEMATKINEYQENYNSFEHIDNGELEAMLRKIKEFYGKFVEISVRAECANIVRALDFDFAKNSLGLTKLHATDSSASLHPVRPYEASASTLPLKWALIALWQLTKEDAFICRTLTEKWQTSGTGDQLALEDVNGTQTSASSRVAKRLDYSTGKCEQSRQSASQIPPEFEEIYKVCPNAKRLQEERLAFLERRGQCENSRPAESSTPGALSSALKSKQMQPVRQVSTIELLIDIIISQPNKHERVDMMNFVQNSKLVDVEELDQSVSAAFYTSNQYKVAALRILNHLCINEQAIRTILKCFSTPPPKQGRPLPENRIIKSVFECYQTSQEHIYQNETIIQGNRTPRRRKRVRHVQEINQNNDCDEYSDYGSRQTNSVPSSVSLENPDLEEADEDDTQGDDAVVKEAIRLLVRLTSPFHASKQGHDYYTLIGRFSIESLVRYLTNIIKSTSSREMILLSLSALANISFITTEPMKSFGTNRIVLEMFRASRERSKDMELRDQSVTILANTADKNFLDIVSNGGLTFLLSCLETCPTRMANYKLLREQIRSDSGSVEGYAVSDTCSLNSRQFNSIENKPRDRKPIQVNADEFIDDLECVCDNQQQTNRPLLCLSRLSPAELAAMERIHQKTAVAFARLSVDSSTTRMVLQYGGVKQMIDLCKLSHRRNHSDSVLIACLAALRKMAKVLGLETFRHYNALDLIELELNQALEIYGRLYASEV